MKYVLDSNIIIYALKGMFPSLKSNFKKISATDVGVPSIVRAELILGALKSAKRDINLRLIKEFLEPFECISFNQEAADHYAAIRARLERAGKVIGPNDLIIAATALTHTAILITHNTKEFSRVEGLLCEDWCVPLG